MQLGKEAIWIQSTVDYVHVRTVYMHTSFAAVTND